MSCQRRGSSLLAELPERWRGAGWRSKEQELCVLTSHGLPDRRCKISLTDCESLVSTWGIQLRKSRLSHRDNLVGKDACYHSLSGISCKASCPPDATQITKEKKIESSTEGHCLPCFEV